MKIDKDALATNPVRLLRKRLGCTRAAFSRETGCPLMTLARAELGLTFSLPRAVMRAAEMVGEDPAALAGDYAEWAVRVRRAYAADVKEERA